MQDRCNILWGFNILMLYFADAFVSINKAGESFDKICKLWLGPKLVVLLYDPRDVELVLSSQVYIDKSYEYSFFKPWLGDGLLISTGKFSILHSILLNHYDKCNKIIS